MNGVKRLNGWGPMLLVTIAVVGAFLGVLRWVHQEMEKLEAKVEAVETAHLVDKTAIENRLGRGGFSLIEAQDWADRMRLVSGHPIPPLKRP